MAIPYPSGYTVEYCTTDKSTADAGCLWGLVLQRHGDLFWVLTTIGVRYYAIPSEHKFLRSGDEGYEAIDICWQHGVAQASALQVHLPRKLRPSV